VAAEVSDEPAAFIFRVDVCRFRIRLGYTDSGHGTQGEEVKKETQFEIMGRSGQIEPL
jgi:hypothetical protein